MFGKVLVWSSLNVRKNIETLKGRLVKWFLFIRILLPSVAAQWNKRSRLIVAQLTAPQGNEMLLEVVTVKFGAAENEGAIHVLLFDGANNVQPFE